MMNLRVNTNQKQRYDIETGEPKTDITVAIRDENDSSLAVIMPEWKVVKGKVVEYQRYEVAHLLAAAPDLKRALSRLRDLCDFRLNQIPDQDAFVEALNYADAALQKAKYNPESEPQAQDAVEEVAV